MADRQTDLKPYKILYQVFQILLSSVYNSITNAFQLTFQVMFAVRHAMDSILRCIFEAIRSLTYTVLLFSINIHIHTYLVAY